MPVELLSKFSALKRISDANSPPTLSRFSRLFVSGRKRGRCWRSNGRKKPNGSKGFGSKQVHTSRELHLIANQEFISRISQLKELRWHPLVSSK